MIEHSKNISEFEDKILCGDSIRLVADLPDQSIHLILSDIPYGIGSDDWDVLHKNTNSAYLGSSPAQKTAGAIFKKRGKPLNGWSDADKRIPYEYYDWCSLWASDWYRILKPGSSVFIFAGRRLSHRCADAMEDIGFIYKDSLAWIRQVVPHRAQRLSVVYSRRSDIENEEKWKGWRVGNLRPKFEPIMWFMKPYKVGGTLADNVLQYGVGAYNQNSFNKYIGNSDNILSVGFDSGEVRVHPTQKPVKLMEILIDLTTISGQIVLDPFVGSGSTTVAAKKIGRKYIGFERDTKYCEIARNRLNNTEVAT